MPPERRLADVSVIIPAYRAAETIGRVLASVVNQTLKPREAIVVDDGSDDGTYEAATAMAERMNGIALKVYRQTNQGAGAARNRAIQEASCRYVAFLDADDEWLPEKLQQTMPYLSGTENVLASHNVCVVEDAKVTLIDCARRFAEADERFVALYRRGYISTSTVVARRDAVMAAGGFDTTLPNGQDFELWLAILRRPGTPFVVFDGALTYNHTTPGSIMSHTGRRLKCCLEIARRYAPALKAYPAPMLPSLWFRILAVHNEAVSAYWLHRNFVNAIATCLRLPFALVVMTAKAVLVPSPVREP